MAKATIKSNNSKYKDLVEELEFDWPSYLSIPDIDIMCVEDYDRAWSRFCNFLENELYTKRGYSLDMLYDIDWYVYDWSI